MKDIISAQQGDIRLVASGRTLHWGKDWKVFPDFLHAYLAGNLNPKWGEPQLKLPVEDQHPINQWYSHLVAEQQATGQNEAGLFVCNTGATLAWAQLAYDLFLIEHNAEIQKKLIKKLRDPTKFQGARFEIAVAAMLLAADYVIDFVPEKGPGKHPEYFAVHKTTGMRIAVEAKSRHRPGIMGFESSSKPDFNSAFDLDGLVRDAVSKDTEEPLLVFIEVNSPTKLTKTNSIGLQNLLDAPWQAAQKLEWEKGFPAIGIVFYNDIRPWHLTEALGTTEPSIWVSAKWPSLNRHKFDSRILLTEVVRGCMKRTEIPHHFPYP